MKYITHNSTSNLIPRESNFELLRIVSMIIIIAHHFSYHSGFMFDNDTITINRLYVQFIQIGGKIGVNVFVLISGYFLISAKSIKMNKVIKIWMQIFTYSSIIYVIFIATGIEPFTIKKLISHCFPVTFSQWWFASTYFVLYLISPYINVLLNSLNKKNYQHFLVSLTVLWCIIPTFTSKSFESNRLLWFIYLYACAGYMKRFNLKTKVKGIVYILLALAITILTFFSAVVFDVLGTKISVFVDHATYFYGMQMIPILIISILLFVGFSKLNIGYNRIINIIASTTFGVYLIHDNSYIRLLLWETIFKNASYQNSSLLIPYSLFVIAIVFSLCVIIELARTYLLEKHYINAINFVAKKADVCKEKFFSLRIFDKI